MKHLTKDIVLITIGVALALTIREFGLVQAFLNVLGPVQWIAIFVAGFLFTSVFTTAIAIVILIHLAETTPAITIALIGGLGAVTSDYIFFRFMRDTILDDIKYLISVTRHKLHIRFFSIFKTQLFRYFLSFIGAVIIILPIPDEIGITLLSLSHVNTRLFMVMSYALHTTGILLIVLLGASAF